MVFWISKIIISPAKHLPSCCYGAAGAKRRQNLTTDDDYGLRDHGTIPDCRRVLRRSTLTDHSSVLSATCSLLLPAQWTHHHRILGQQTVRGDLGRFGTRFLLASRQLLNRSMHCHGGAGNVVTWHFQIG